MDYHQKIATDPNDFIHLFMSYNYGYLWYLNPIMHLIKYYHTRCGITTEVILAADIIGNKRTKLTKRDIT